jgi:hypothetical protein
MLQTATVELSIAESILAQQHLVVKVACPPEVPQKIGVVFICGAQLDVGTYPLRATVTSDSGHVRYENESPLAVLDVAAVQRAIAHSILGHRGLIASVACPRTVLQKAGITFACVASAKGQHYRFHVTVIDDSGHVRYVERG